MGIESNILLNNISSANSKFLSAIIIERKFPEKILQIKKLN